MKTVRASAFPSSDDIIVQRYVEIDGQLKSVLAVFKMRGSDQATDFGEYSLAATGAVMGESRSGYHGITTGVPALAAEPCRTESTRVEPNLALPSGS